MGFNKQRFVLFTTGQTSFYCFSFELPSSLMFSSDTRKERETQLAEHVSYRSPVRLFYRVSTCLSLFPKTSNRGFPFHRCGELFLLYVTSQTIKSKNVTLPFTLPSSRSSRGCSYNSRSVAPILLSATPHRSFSRLHRNSFVLIS